MKTRDAVGAVALLLVVIALVWARQRTSPGALAKVHAREHLSDAGACADCHGSGRLGMAAACASCHVDIDSAITEHRGLHGRLAPSLAADCARCHSDHQGSGFRLVGDAAFERAGFAGPEAYRHEGLEFDLVGEHAALDCERCHEHADVAVLPPGERRFGGLTQSCTECHADPHEDRYGSDCASCHGQQQPFEAIGGIDHDRFCPLVGSHAALDCQACHVEGSPHAVDALIVSRATNRMSGNRTSGAARDCVACHVSPHRDAFVAGVVERFEHTTAAAGEALQPGTSCRVCHGAEHESFGADVGLLELDPAWHSASGFDLAEPHASLDCAQCHPGLGTRPALEATSIDDAPGLPVDLDAFLADFPGRLADDCRSCHADPHLGQFEHGELAGTRCLDCHERHAFAPSRFDAEFHDATAFGLVGAHAAADCAACHRLPSDAPDTPAGRATRHFTGVATECAACHTSPHRDSYVEGVARQLALQGGGTATCGRCHDAAEPDFTAPRAALAAQAHALTGFALTGPHDGVGCVDCHAGFGTPKLTADQTTPPARLAAAAHVAPPPPPGRPSAAFRAAYPGRGPDACAACHADPHQGQFEHGAWLGQDCLACHARDSFTPPVFGTVEHAATAFPLDGAHLAVGCTDCHLRGGQARTGARAALAGTPSDKARIFAGTPSDCASCHADVHGGAFDGPGQPVTIAGASGCARCHVTESFSDVTGGRFDHRRWTGYPLQGAHAGLDCAACHRPRPSSGADGRLFGRVPGNQCADCHALGSVSRDALGEALR